MISKISKILRHCASVVTNTDSTSIVYMLAKIADLDEESAVKLLFNFSADKTKLINRLPHLNDGDLIRRYISVMFQFLDSQPTIVDSLSDSISEGQMLSKGWLVDTLSDLGILNTGNLLLCGGWYATLLFDKRLVFDKCLSVDIDQSANLVAERIHWEKVSDNKFRALDLDLLEFVSEQKIIHNGESFKFDPATFINTSCEHIPAVEFSKWWDKLPKGKLVVLQSNNAFDIEGHVNCYLSLDQFTADTPMAQVLYSGEKDVGKFTRFMRIGYR